MRRAHSCAHAFFSCLALHHEELAAGEFSTLGENVFTIHLRVPVVRQQATNSINLGSSLKSACRDGWRGQLLGVASMFWFKMHVFLEREIPNQWVLDGIGLFSPPNPGNRDAWVPGLP